MRTVLPILLVALWATAASAADQKAIDRALKRGSTYLANQFKGLKKPEGGEGIGPAALAGLALLETGRTIDDPAVKAITSAVRDASYSENRTYQLSLCLLFLDRLGQKRDEPLIQLCAVRLLAGQNANGGWTYDCITSVPDAEERRLRAKLDTNQLVAEGKGTNPGPAPKDSPHGGKLHAEVERHRQGLLANVRNRLNLPDDNSNTQFAILALWVARKHGVNTEAALEALENRFLKSQLPGGGWPYSGLLGEGSPSMICAGLLGLATAVGRREERRLHAAPPKLAEPKPEPKPGGDEFFTPVPKPEPKKPEPKKFAADARDKAVERGLDALATVLKNGRRGAAVRAKYSERDLYFLWSLERVGVVYGLHKIGNLDWYDLGADILIPAQRADGSWPDGGHSADVDTAFALLFLARSNLVRDLSAKVQRDPLNSELRGGPGLTLLDPDPSPEPRPMAKADPAPVPSPNLPAPTVVRPAPIPAGDDAAKLAEALLKVPAASWAKSLEQLRDGKGPDFTAALVLVIGQTDGDRRKQAREALSERLARMNAATLRNLLKGDDAELRRAAALACAMKDDKTHIPDLIDRIAHDDEFVVKAARAALKSLSGGQDYGPEPGFSKLDRAASVEEWTAWWARSKRN